jgi:hypothetical protein
MRQRCRATFPNPDDELRSGLSATLVFPTKIKKAFRIPRTAAVRLQNQLMFYRVKKELFMDIICEIERLCDSVVNIAEARYSRKKSRSYS